MSVALNRAGQGFAKHAPLLRIKWFREANLVFTLARSQRPRVAKVLRDGLSLSAAFRGQWPTGILPERQEYLPV